MISFQRVDKKGKELTVVCNFSPVHRPGYRVGVPRGGRYQVVFNSDDPAYGGSGKGDKEVLRTEAIPCHGQEQSLVLDVPPMATVLYRCIRTFPKRKPREEKVQE